MERIEENNFHHINIMALPTLCQVGQFTESNIASLDHPLMVGATHVKSTESL